MSDDFEAVREAFAENFSRRKELGAACCVYRNGEKVVDLWGGIRNKATGEPWEADTMVLVFSATKGLAAMVMALAHSRGLLDYEERVATYWPEFAQNGKGDVTVRQLLAHQAGLFAFDERVDKDVVADLDRLANIMARQRPEWEPGSRQAYHAISLGFYEGELLRRIDPQHRTLGQFSQDEIARPLGADIYIRLPEEIPNSRLATLRKAKTCEVIFGLPFRLLLTSMNPRSPIFRALLRPNPRPWVPLDSERIYARNLEVPSGGGVGSARGIARVYSAFATGGHELGLRRKTLEGLMEPAVPPTHGFRDKGLKSEVQFSLGFFKPTAQQPFGRPGAFGSPGSGGAFGFTDPELGLAYAYVTNRMGRNVVTDDRDIALRDALSSVTPLQERRKITMSTAIERPPELTGRDVPTKSSRATLVKVLLACGVLHSLLYVVVNDLVAATLYDGYSRMTQAVSELSAVGAPTQALITAMVPVFTVLLIAFGVGVWKSAQGKRAPRVAGALLVAHGATAPLWLFAPMSQREVIAAGEGTSSDTMHLFLSALAVLFIVSYMAFAAAAFGKRFRLYSLLSIATVLVFGAVTGMQSANIEAGEPAPWLGLAERISLGAWLLWMAVLVIVV